MTDSQYYNRNEQGCHFRLSRYVESAYDVFDANGNYLCTADFEGAQNVCEAISKFE